LGLIGFQCENVVANCIFRVPVLAVMPEQRL
jgi:hypothetical protein